MLPLERRSEILKQLEKDGTVYVSSLSESFGVTEETIRRDLERLETAGHLVRTHGGAIRSDANTPKLEQSAKIRKATNIKEKTAIAKLISNLIQDGDDIMVDDSSTSLFAVQELKKKHNLTLITNSLDILSEVADASDWNVMGTGGVLRERSMSFVGNQAETMITNFYVDKAIISCKGLDISRGFTDSTEPSALIKRRMIDSAREVILAVDSSKFDLISFVQIGRLNRVTAIVTDKAPSQQWLDVLAEYQIACIYPS